MSVKPIPDGYHSVTPYLVVKGVEGLIDFLGRAFGATVEFKKKQADGTVNHASMQLGDSKIMMGEASPHFAATSTTLYIYVADADAVYRRALDAGGTSLREPADQIYGDRSGGVADPFGNQWWMATHIEDVSPEELERRSAAAQAQPSA